MLVTIVRGCAADICDVPDLCRSRRQPVHSKFQGWTVCSMGEWVVGGWKGETARRRKGAEDYGSSDGGDERTMPRQTD